jgi:hypothetical protein
MPEPGRRDNDAGHVLRERRSHDWILALRTPVSQSVPPKAHSGAVGVRLSLGTQRLDFCESALLLHALENTEVDVSPVRTTC